MQCTTRISIWGKCIKNTDLHSYIYIAIYTGVSDTYKHNLPLERLDYPSLTDLYR